MRPGLSSVLFHPGQACKADPALERTSCHRPTCHLQVRTRQGSLPTVC